MIVEIAYENLKNTPYFITILHIYHKHTYI